MIIHTLVCKRRIGYIVFMCVFSFITLQGMIYFFNGKYIEEKLALLRDNRRHADDATLTHRYNNTNINLTGDKRQFLFDYKHMVKLIGNSEIPFTASSDFVMENPHLCSSVRDLLAVILVHTSTTNFRQRRTIRRTWGNITSTEYVGSFRVLFMVGRSESAETKKRLHMEQYMYKDILQGDFKDTYGNLTLKGVMGLKWVTERCMNTQFVVKTDDDVVVNTPFLLTDIHQQMIRARKTLICEFHSAITIDRNQENKWFIEPSQLPNSQNYPVYCFGYFVAITKDLIPYLFEAARRTPFFWVDDVYLYGLLPTLIPGVVHTTSERGVITLKSQVVRSCLQINKCEVVAAGQLTTHLQDTFWSCIRHRRTHEQSDRRMHCIDDTKYISNMNSDLLMDLLFPN